MSNAKLNHVQTSSQHNGQIGPISKDNFLMRNLGHILLDQSIITSLLRLPICGLRICTLQQNMYSLVTVDSIASIIKTKLEPLCSHATAVSLLCHCQMQCLQSTQSPQPTFGNWCVNFHSPRKTKDPSESMASQQELRHVPGPF